MKESGVGRPVKEKTDAEIDEFIDTLKKACQSFDAIIMLASRTTPSLSDDECKQFEKLCKQFGAEWRKIPTMTSRPMKLHYLESHLWVQMWLFRTIAFADEGGIERLHHWWNILNALYAPMRNWQVRTTAICKRFAMENFGSVKERVKQMFAATRRRWSVDETGKRSAKRDNDGQVKAEKIQAAVDAP